MSGVSDPPDSDNTDREPSAAATPDADAADAATFHSAHPAHPAAGRGSVNKPVFLAAAGIVLGFAIWALAAPESAETVVGEVKTFISTWFGWWYFILATGIVGLVVFLGVSRYGRYRLGPEESRPEYSLFTWTAMLFAAGIGIDLMFFSVAEPVYNYLYPPTEVAQTNEAARAATTWTIFHYGLSGWAMYALMGAALAYFAFRHNLPLTIRAALYPIFGKRVHGRWGDAIDVAAVLGTIFGIATSLGIGIVQLNYGLHEMFGIDQGKAAQIGLIVLSVIVATISATTGVDRGIRRLSELNVIMAIALLIYILVAGRSDFLLNALAQNMRRLRLDLPRPHPRHLRLGTQSGDAEPAHRLAGCLDVVLLGLVGGVGAVRRTVPGADLARAHAAPVRVRGAGGAVQLHPDVDLDLR